MKDKQLACRDRDEVLWKAKNGLALTLKELAIASGYGYSRWRSWKASGLPLMAGKITLKRAQEWLDRLPAPKAEESEAQRLSHLADAASNKLGELV